MDINNELQDFNRKSGSELSDGNLIECLTQYYEAAGFSDVFEKELKGKSRAELIELYDQIRSDQ